MRHGDGSSDGLRVEAVKEGLRAGLLAWYARARRDLPWRRTSDPYAVWVSETMLQQTRVETVVPYYERFLRELPTVRDLAEAPRDRVLTLWSGLGYYRRARMLHDAAKQVVDRHGGALPGDPADLRALAGVGAYTAGAIASIAFKRRAALVDGNVARVLARIFAIDQDVKSAAGVARLWRLAEALVSDGDADPGDWNQALMELGATICTPRQPKCGECPARAWCLGHAAGTAAELPRAAPKKRPIDVRRAALVVASPRAVLLARRRPDALFGGLWEPPGAAGDGIALARRLGIDPGAVEPAGRVVHVLSHRRMIVDVARAPLGRRLRWSVPGGEYDAIEVVALDGLGARPLGALARKILAAAAVIGV